MTEILRIKRNLRKMVEQGAPQEHIDQYLQQEKITPEQLQAAPKLSELEAQDAPTVGSMVNQALSGVNEGLMALPNMAVDGSNWLLDKAGLYDAMGVKKPVPFGGGEMTSKFMNDVGWTKPPSKHGSEQFVRRIGQELGGTVIPGGAMVRQGGKSVNAGVKLLKNPSKNAMLGKGQAMAQALKGGVDDMGRAAFGNGGAKDLAKFAGTEAAISTGSGVGAATAQQLAPDSQLAEIAGQILGGGAAAVTPNVARNRKAVRQYKKEVPTTDQLKQQKNDAYAKVDNQDTVYNGTATQELADNIDAEMQFQNIDKDISAKANKINEKIKAMGGEEQKFMKIEQVRKLAKRALAKSTDGDEQHLGKIIIEMLDDFFGGATSKDIVSGNAENTAKAITDARKINTRYSKAKNYDRMLERAQDGKSDFVTGAKNEIGKMLTNDSKYKFTNPAERELYRQAKNDTGLQNALSKTAKAGPSSHSYGMAHGIHIAASPFTGIPLAVGMKGAELAGKNMAKKRIMNLGDILKSGKPIPKSTPINARERAALIAALLGNQQPEGE